MLTYARKFTYLSAAKNSNKKYLTSDMAKVNIKSEKITPFGGIYYASKAFYALSLDKIINNTNPRLNDLLMKLNMKMGLFKSGQTVNVDFDHVFV